jgi:hypothetical protein
MSPKRRSKGKKKYSQIVQEGETLTKLEIEEVSISFNGDID